MQIASSAISTALTFERCFVSTRPHDDQIRPCYGPCQDHHLIAQQRIKRAHKTLVAAHRRGGPKPWPLSEALADRRNMVRVCWGHHQLIEGMRITVSTRDIDLGFFDFVAKYALHPYVPRCLL